MFCMAQGPVLIFDKSTLESLNPDEAVWLDNFFLTNITPLFFIEVLADLEKEVHLGRTPEEVVGNLACKTPDMQSNPNVHHTRLLAAELSGAETIVMDGRLIVPGGKPVTLEGKTGIVFQRTQEEEAFERWQRHEFLDVERLIARSWRMALSNVDHSRAYKFFQKWFAGGKKPKTLSDVKSLADANIDRTDQENCLKFGLSLLGISAGWQEQVVARWQSVGKPAIRKFAPYFSYVLSVDLFFYLGTAADLISRVRPNNKVSNKVDLAYLYYLPFCMVFASNDKLHERAVPLFLRADQTFVKGADLKADLGRLDQHYSSLPEEVKDQSPFHFADCPPSDSSFLITQLWDKHLPAWRNRQDDPKGFVDEGAQRALLDLMNCIEREAVPINPAIRVSTDNVEYVQMQRLVSPRKGKWKRFPPEVRLKRDEEC